MAIRNGSNQLTTLVGDKQSVQIRRAWNTLIAAFSVFLTLCVVLAGAGYWYRGHATAKDVACVEVVEGDRASVRPAYQLNWSAIPLGNSCTNRLLELREGDTLQTGKDTHVLLNMWNSTIVEVFEESEIQITELRTTQYISRASAVTIRQQKGLLRVAMAPGPYARSRLQILAGDTTVVMKEGAGESGGGSFIVEVPRDTAASNPDGRGVRASVRRGIASVRVAGYPGELRLAANEQTIVSPGGTPGEPTASRRDLLANGRFDQIDGRFPSWTSISTPGQVDGPVGRLALVPDTMNGESIQALEISRSMSSVDPANTGLRQILDVTIADLPSVILSADLKVFEQNVAGGGQLGSEFPIIVRINYYDLSNTNVLQNRIWGYYVVPAANGVASPNSTLVPPGEWQALRIELRDLVPQPARLESIDIYASGHGYRARITNVSIVGTEECVEGGSGAGTGTSCR